MTSQWPHTYAFNTPPRCRQSYRLLTVHKHPRQCMMLRTHTSILPLTVNLIGRVPQAKKSRGKTDTVLYIGSFPTMFLLSHHGYSWQASTSLPLDLCIGPFPTGLFRLAAHGHIKSAANSLLPWLWTYPGFPRVEKNSGLPFCFCRAKSGRQLLQDRTPKTVLTSQRECPESVCHWLMLLRENI